LSVFEETQRALRQFQGKLSVSIPLDAEGYFDRECPSADCLFQFKVHEDDWRDKVRDAEVFCPFCGHTADAQKWWTKQQIKYAEKAAAAQINRRLNQAMKRDADRWNRRQPRNSFISMTMKAESRPAHVSLPPAAARPMQLKIVCPQCACRYAVIGAAFFCPACGHNAAEQMFGFALEGIRKMLDALDAVRAAIPDRDIAENTVRLIVENGLQNAVTAFQRYAEALYARFPGVERPRRNAFQNLAEGSDLWHAATGRRYDAYLDPEELGTLTRAFQQRHLLAHTHGLVDEDYIRKSGDTSYRPRQRIVVRAAAVRESVALIEKLAAGMAAERMSGLEA
jgi:hypothetical protein